MNISPILPLNQFVDGTRLNACMCVHCAYILDRVLSTLLGTVQAPGLNRISKNFSGNFMTFNLKIAEMNKCCLKFTNTDNEYS